MLAGNLTSTDLWVALGAIFLCLVLRYPDRVIFTSPGGDVPEGMPLVFPLLGPLPIIPFRIHEDRSMLSLFLLSAMAPLPRKKDRGKEKWPRTSTMPFVGRYWMLNHPTYIEHVQRTNFERYIKGETPRGLFGTFLGRNGIFLADGPLWSGQRKLANSIFAANKHAPVVETVMHRMLDKLRSLFTSASETGTLVQLQDIYMRIMLDSFALVAFDHSFETLPSDVSGLRSANAFAKALDNTQDVGNSRLYVVGWQLIEWLLPYGYEMRRNTKLIHETIYEIIDERLAARNADPAAKQKADLLGLFADHVNDREQLMETMLAFIFAGRDTTAQAMSWLTYELLMHPRHITRCREEIASVLGVGDLQRDMAFEDVAEMPYLNAVFHEALRLHPSVPKNMRELAEDDVLPPLPEEGVPAIPMRKGETCFWSDWVMARTPSVWGEDCNEFKPERFLDEAGRLKHYSQYKFQAFNSGPRRCLGATLATYEAMAIMASILGRWDLRLAPGTEPPKPRASLTLPIANPYSVSVRPRAA